MNVTTLLKVGFYLDWLRLLRAPQFKSNLVVRIITGIVTFYLLLNFLILGYLVDIPLKKHFPDRNVVTLINPQLIYLFVLLLIARFLFEKLPFVDFRFFLCLPVKKSCIIIAYLSRLWASKLNLIPVLIALPFWIKNILPSYSVIGGIYWLAGFLLVNFCFTLLGLLLRLLLVNIKMGAILFLSLMTFAISIDLAKHTDILRIFSTFVFDSLLNSASLALLICIFLSLFFTVVTYNILQKALYLDFGS